MKKILKQLFIMFCLLAAPLGVNAQTSQTKQANPKTKKTPPAREYIIDDDGFEWYRIYKNGKYGAENKSGTILVPAEYDYVGCIPVWPGAVTYRFDHNVTVPGNFMARKGQFYSFYTLDGTCLIPYSRQYTNITQDVEEFMGTFYTCEKEEYLIFCDVNGREVFSFKKDNRIKYYIPQLRDNLLYFTLRTNDDLYGIADGKGNIIIDPVYSSQVCVLKEEIVLSDEAQSKLANTSIITTSNPFANNPIFPRITNTTLNHSSSPSSSSSVYDFIFDLYSKKTANEELSPLPKMPKREKDTFIEYIVRVELNTNSIDYKILTVDRMNNDRINVLESYSINPSSGALGITSDGIQFCEYENGKPRGILINSKVVTVGKWNNNEFDDGWFFPQFSLYSNVDGTVGNTIAIYKGLIEGFNKNKNFKHTQAGETDFQGKYTKLKNALQKYNWKKIVR